MKFAVIGDQGMFGRDMSNHLMSSGFDVLGLNRSNFDIHEDARSIATALGRVDVIVNAIAKTAVDDIELDPHEAAYVNGDFVGKLGKASQIIDAKLMHISTDYVFNGKYPKKLLPTDVPMPINKYGETKLLGERFLEDFSENSVVFRTSSLYGAGGESFPKSIVRKLKETSEARVVDDQECQPTWTMDLAELVLQHSIHNYGEHFVHATSDGHASWFEFSLEILKSLPNNNEFRISPISSTVLNRPANRPSFSVLETSKTIGPRIGNWRDRWQDASSTILHLLE